MSPDETLKRAESGWTRPQKTRSVDDLRTLIAQTKAQLEALEQELAPLEEQARLEAIAKIRNIMRAHDLSTAEIGLHSSSRRAG